MCTPINESELVKPLFVTKKCLSFKGLLLVTVSTSAFDPLKDAKMIIINNCKDKVGASEDDVKIVLDHGLPKTDQGLCLVECLLTQGNMMKNGKLNKNGFLASAKREKKYTAGEITQLEKMVADCEQEINSANLDGCQTAKQIIECSTTKGKDFGFQFPSRL
ncbi:hypothetical protein RN001_007803 [Aquatica leii]|uniref:Uncharacterized protein n=1 Tax=Aquatica leii TaxID=1421715 RepID=A0AAN7P8U4_9COLE|nr:hypothetical protein RN001_007803 [Aquatica leii]